MTLQDATRDATDRWAGVPTPQVEGPIAYVEDDLDNRNYPFFLANDLDLAGRGYVAEEFFTPVRRMVITPHYLRSRSRARRRSRT